jgi:hypothetical protein
VFMWKMGAERKRRVWRQWGIYGRSETREQKVFEMQELYEKYKILYGFILEIYCSVTGNGLCFSPVLTLIRRRL